jgi:phage terminase Nu1 subunit (DNA packaging protein)
MVDIKAVQQRLIDLTEEFKEYVELQKKPKSKLSRTAKKRLADMEADLRSILEPEERSDFIYDAANVGRFFGVTPRAVQKWVSQKGCPKLRHGIYDLKAVYEWWLENIRGDGGQSVPEVEDAKLEYWRWKAKREKISVQRLRGELLEKKLVAHQWALRVGELTGALSTLKDRLPPLVEGKSRQEISKIIDDEIWRLRDAYARRGEYCHTKDA